jgi:hypothetical protein
MSFSPTSISGLRGWFTGDSASVSNGNVTSWQDISGQGNHATSIRGTPKISDPSASSTIDTFIASYSATNVPGSSSADGWREHTFGEFELPDRFSQNNYTFRVTVTSATGNEMTPTAEYVSIGMRKKGGGPYTNLTFNPQTVGVTGSYPTIYYTNKTQSSTQISLPSGAAPFAAGDTVYIYLSIYRRWFSVMNLTVELDYTGVANGVNNSTQPKYLYGSQSDGIQFPTSVLSTNQNYTLFHVAKYYGPFKPLSRGRIFDGITVNWLSGFHAGKSGVAYHDKWMTQSSADLHGNDWIISTDSNNIYRSYGINRHNTTGGVSSGFSINYGAYTGANYTSETSDWAVAEVIVYNSVLSASNYEQVEDYLMAKYTNMLDLQAISVLEGTISNTPQTAPHSLSELYGKNFTEGGGFPSSGTISLGLFRFRVFAPPVVAAGQVAYTSPGTYYFTVPAGVTSISCVVIGGGGGSSGCSGASQYSGAGGGGGGLVYGTISVTAGQTVTVLVGAGGTAGTNVNSSTNIAGNGGESRISYGGISMLRAFGGAGGRYGVTYNAYGGGRNYYYSSPPQGGGIGGYGGRGTNNGGGGGGGGAGGYAGNGGGGGIGNTGVGGAGSGGGAGGGGGQANSGTQNNGGGGTGLYGQGSNGAGGARNGSGGGGSLGSGGGNGGIGGLYGGGAGGCEDDTNRSGSVGGRGGARIIWGTGRSYPSTNTANV